MDKIRTRDEKIAGMEATMQSPENSGAEINWEKQFAASDEKKGASLRIAKHLIELFSVKTIGGERIVKYTSMKGGYMYGERTL